MKCVTCDHEAPKGESTCDWCLAWPGCLTCEATGEVLTHRGGESEYVDCPTCHGMGTLDGTPSNDGDRLAARAR